MHGDDEGKKLVLHIHIQKIDKTAEALRMENKLPKKLPTDENIQAVADTIKKITNLNVII